MAPDEDRAMPPDEDHERLADERFKEADRLAGENEQLAKEIDEVRSDWAAKRQDEGVPGAAPPKGDEADADTDDDPDDDPDDDASSEDRPDRRSST